MPRKIKDKEAPKAPVNPYMHYQLEHAGPMKEKFENSEGLSPIEITREIYRKCSKQWSELSPSSKEKYIQMYRDDKARYKEELKMYHASPQYAQRRQEAEARILSSSIKGSNIKKRSAPGKIPVMVESYFEFMGNNWRDIAVTNPQMEPEDIQDKLWHIWSGVKPKSTSKRERKIKESNKSVPKSISVKKKISVSVKSAFDFFLDVVREELVKCAPDLSNKQIEKHVRSKWNSMSSEQRRPYEDLEKEEKKKQIEVCNVSDSKENGVQLENVSTSNDLTSSPESPGMSVVGEHFLSPLMIDDKPESNSSTSNNNNNEVDLSISSSSSSSVDLSDSDTDDEKQSESSASSN